MIKNALLSNVGDCKLFPKITKEFFIEYVTQ